MAARLALTTGEKRRAAAPVAVPEPMPRTKDVAEPVDLVPSSAAEVRAATTRHSKLAPLQEPAAASVDADSVPSLRAMEVGRAPEGPPINDGALRLEEQCDEPSAQQESDRATLPSFRKQRRAWTRRVGWVLGVGAAAATFALRGGEAPPEPPHDGAVPVVASRTGEVGATAQQGTTVTTSHIESTSAPEAPKVEPAVEPASPAPNHASDEVVYDAQRLRFALRWAKSHAEECHRWGRAVGTAELAITFSPDGRVAGFELTGEPVAGAPVAGCVESYYRAMLIPAFEGKPFTVHESLTLR